MRVHTPAIIAHPFPSRASPWKRPHLWKSAQTADFAQGAWKASLSTLSTAVLTKFLVLSLLNMPNFHRHNYKAKCTKSEIPA